MKTGAGIPSESAEDFFEGAPCAFAATALDGTIVKVNRAFERLSGLSREELVGQKRFRDLLSVGGRIYYETHVGPLLKMQGEVHEIALEVRRADGTRVPVLINSALTDGEPPLIRTLAFEAGDRRRYEQELLRSQRHEQETARSLQQSLLAVDLPRTRGLDLAGAYSPAVSGLEVGGDWYDAFWLERGTVALVVGDVVGRGVLAATTMGQLRSATRALASTGLGPAELIEALDVYRERHDVGNVATIAYAELDLAALELRLACAGHPPPVLALGTEPPRLAWEGRSPPLGALGPGLRRPEATYPLRPGGLVLLYTDGLIERRDRPIDQGFASLLKAVETHREQPSSPLTAQVMRALEDSDSTDDVCLLAAQVDASARSAVA